MDRIAMIVHPTRDVERAVAGVREWAGARGVEVAGEDGIDGAQVIVAVGGDGTVLAALRAAAPAGLPVLGVACGSLGALTTVSAPDVATALERFDAGDWTPHRVPALEAQAADGAAATAINDLVVVRDGGGQVTVEAWVDGELYGRFAGDGAIVSTQLGSSAYALAAGGPLLAVGSGAWLVTPLAPHGGCLPPIVVGAAARVRLEVNGGYAGARVEVDGRPSRLTAGHLELSLRPGFATLVRVGEGETFLGGLRRRGIITDSPRVLARDEREAQRLRAAGDNAGFS